MGKGNSNNEMRIGVFCGGLESKLKNKLKGNSVAEEIIKFIKDSEGKNTEQRILRIKAMADGAEGKYRSFGQQQSAKGKFEKFVEAYKTKSGLGRQDHMTLELFEECMNKKFPKELVYPRNSDLENRMWNYVF